MVHKVTVFPIGTTAQASHGMTLLSFLQRTGMVIDAPCSGKGTCGKCKVLLDGKLVSACKTLIDRDMTVTLQDRPSAVLVEDSENVQKTSPVSGQCLLAVDIGTTTLAASLVNLSDGAELASIGCTNPQISYGADVISRIQCALTGQQQTLTETVRHAITSMTEKLCKIAGIMPMQIRTVSVVGNPAMQQLFLGIDVQNLARIPFASVLTEARTAPAAECLPICEKAQLYTVPDISGFVGADTLGCVLASGMAQHDDITLLVDIGTNGEMVLGNRSRMIACATAAGPALEGATIHFGMRGQPGAIDHVWLQDGKMQYCVIGGGRAEGICGTGLVDAVAAALELGLLNSRGRIQNESRQIALNETVYLTQEDIRQLQLAKGAIAAGIELMAAQYGISLHDIDRVLLAGAFGTYMNPASACRIGLLPEALQGKSQPIGNAALRGAVMLGCDEKVFFGSQDLLPCIEFLELATLPGFQYCFAKNMRF